MQHPGSVVILFTAYASLANAIAAIREGAADMLTKPVDFVRLRSQLEALLSGTRRRRRVGSGTFRASECFPRSFRFRYPPAGI